MYADHLTKARAALGAFESPEAVFDACVDSMSDHLDAEKVCLICSRSFVSKQTPFFNLLIYLGIINRKTLKTTDKY